MPAPSEFPDPADEAQRQHNAEQVKAMEVVLAEWIEEIKRRIKNAKGTGYDLYHEVFEFPE